MTQKTLTWQTALFNSPNVVPVVVDVKGYPTVRETDREDFMTGKVSLKADPADPIATRVLENLLKERMALEAASAPPSA